MGLEDQIVQWFTYMAYDPMSVYLMVVVLMFASSFGLPLPEEVTIISSSLTAYMATHPDKYPPPSDIDNPVNPYTLALICLLSVFLTDYLVYWIGSHFGDHLKSHPRWSLYFKKKSFKKVQQWIHDYGTFAPCIFRFTPGIRFPGHLMCGIIQFPRWKFIGVVGIAALLTVPTQVLLISFYGEIILSLLSKIKLTFLFLVILFIAIFYFWKRNKTSQINMKY